MLTGASTPKVLSSANKNLRAVVRRAIQDEIGVLARVWIFSQSVEQSFGETSPLEGFEELLWNNHVGVDILDMKWGRNALQNDKFLNRRGRSYGRQSGRGAVG